MPGMANNNNDNETPDRTTCVFCSRQQSTTQESSLHRACPFSSRNLNPLSAHGIRPRFLKLRNKIGSMRALAYLIGETKR